MLDINIASKLVNFNPNSLLAPNSWVGHLPFAYWIIKKLRPATFVELGTHTGNSYFSFCQSIHENKTPTRAFAVDTWTGDIHAGFYDESVFKSVEDANHKYKSFSTLMRGTFGSAVENFNSKSIDLLHIDGLHTYEAVKNDFETWLPKMSDTGVILFHDTNVRRDDFGVYKLWAELSKKYKSFEFFHSHGLGILELSQESSQVIPKSEQEKDDLREFFAGLGNHMQTKFERDSLASERDRLASERDSLASERDSLASEVELTQRSRALRLAKAIRRVIFGKK
jgi:hypothetical protein